MGQLQVGEGLGRAWGRLMSRLFNFAAPWDQVLVFLVLVFLVCFLQV